MSIGFTGTRNPLTLQQRTALEMALSAAVARGDVEFHHGACVGADAASHLSALARGMHVIVHPPVNESKMMPAEMLIPARGANITVLPPKDYHARNRDIVNASTYLLAMPDGPERPHSGTWYTIRYAESRGIIAHIVYPDGSIKTPDGTEVPVANGAMS